ncbi:uclacyanin-3 isoform X2 [Eutrema salsugineum]|uniref:uclacyanin-3 isoform X2 n=1 Tax=Eutrema salsugineum TaxID=72664 RepID=UPI000CED0699|nr:uclacyanin-3 isoform X2 [Eutrema salsugineum]
MGLTGAVAILLIASFPAIFAVTFQVGDTSGWESGVDYTTWVSGKTFRVGDTLEFKYGPTHSVSVVDKADFDACDSSAATEVFSDGDTSIDLTGVGTIHFICPTPGHCLGGMKLAIPVLAAVSSPATPSPSTPSPSPSPTSQQSPSTTSPSPSPPNAASKGVMSYGMIGVTMVLMYNIMS